MRRIIIAVACVLFVGGQVLNAEPVLLGAGGILDTLYGLGNITEVQEDDLWVNPGHGHVAAQAKWAGYAQDFGFLRGPSGADFSHLFTVTGGGYLGSSLSASFQASETGEVFRFADDPSGAPMWSSQASDNSDDEDHTRTFMITGGANAGHYAICWEDLPNLGDSDYQDLIVEVCGVAPVPEPATVAVLGLGSIVLLRRRRKYVG